MSTDSVIAPGFAIDCVGIEKQSSLDFANQLFDLHERGFVTIALPFRDHDIPAGVRLIDWVPTQSGGGWFSRTVVPNTSSNPAQVSSSSGTTGAPKNFVISHRALADVTKRLIDKSGLNQAAREYIAVPLTYSFGLGRLRAIAAVGGAAFIPDGGFRPDQLARLILSDGVNAFSAVPTMLRVLIDNQGLLRGTGAEIQWLEIGSQYMSADEKMAVRAMFPNANIIQHYGLTEASRTTFLQISGEAPADLESVGQASGDVQVRINNDGLICIRGPHLANGIVSASGVIPITDEAGWLQTSDLGMLSDKSLHYLGRNDYVANVGGVKVSSEVFEQHISSLLQNNIDFAALPIPDPLRGEIILIAYLSNISSSSLVDLAEATAQAASHFGVSGGVRSYAISKISRTETGKIQRQDVLATYNNEFKIDRFTPTEGASYSRWIMPLIKQSFYKQILVEMGASIGAISIGWQSVTEIYSKLTGKRYIVDTDTFTSIGGDSLTYIQTSIALEEYLGILPPDWETISVANLQKIYGSYDER